MSPARIWPLRTRLRTRSIVVSICMTAAVSAAPLDAANHTGIRVVVTGETGKAVKDASVLVHADGTRRPSRRPDDVTVKTDLDGLAKIEVSAGVYDVCVMSDSSTPHCSKVLVDEGFISERAVRLARDPLINLLEQRVVIPVPAAAQASAPAPRRGEPCWSKDEPDHPDVKRQVLKLAEGLERRRVARTDIALRVCVNDDGSVERVILLVSSGSDSVDRTFRDQAMKWKFKPLQVNGKPVRSAGDVALSWQY